MRTISDTLKEHAALFFTRIRSCASIVAFSLGKKEWKRGKGSFPQFVLCITSLLSVSTGSNRAAVASNCSSLLPGAPRVQSRIHEFLVRNPPLRSSSPTSPPPPLFPCPASLPGPPSFVYRVCTENISHACRTGDRKKSHDVNRDVRVIVENAKCPFYIFYTSSGELLFVHTEQ